MRKFMILFLFIFTVSYAQNINDTEVKEYYYQILLKQWQKSGDYHEFSPRSFTHREWSNLKSEEMVKEEIHKYYPKLRILGRIENKIMGKNLEYLLVRIRGLPKNEQMWFLISVSLKKIVATYKDKITPDMPVKDSLWWPQEWDAREFYITLFEMWKADTSCDCPLKWGGLYTWDHFFDEIKNIDSVTAVFIATKAAQKCFGPEMAALPPRLMGNNDEYWLVYCFPSILFEKRIDLCYDHLVWRYENGRLFVPNTITEQLDCETLIADIYNKATNFEQRIYISYLALMKRYKYGSLYSAPFDRLPYGFQRIVVLISKANGRVLCMTEITE